MTIIIRLLSTTSFNTYEDQRDEALVNSQHSTVRESFIEMRWDDGDGRPDRTRVEMMA